MKTTNLLGLLILFVLPFAFTACDDDDNAQIVTMRVSSTPVYYAPSFWASWPIEGMAVDEDGVDYMMPLSFNEIEGFTYERGYEYMLRVRKIQLENPLQDVSSIEYELESVLSKIKKETTYGSFGVIVRKVVVDIEGQKLTVEEKTALETKILSEVPTVGGGYKFVYTQPEDKAGKMLIYQERYGTVIAKEGAFVQKYVYDSPVPFVTYAMKLSSGQEEYSFSYNTDKSQVVDGFYTPFVLKLDLTGHYKTDYPTVESVKVKEYISLEFPVFSNMI